MSDEILIQVRNLKKVFKGREAVHALNGVDMDIRSGEVVVGFSTANRLRRGGKNAFDTYTALNEEHIDLPFRACAEALCESAAYLYLIFTGRERKYLAVGVYDVILRTVYTRLKHPVYGIVARAAYAYHLDLGNFGGIGKAEIIVEHF